MNMVSRSVHIVLRTRMHVCDECRGIIQNHTLSNGEYRFQNWQTTQAGDRTDIVANPDRVRRQPPPEGEARTITAQEYNPWMGSRPPDPALFGMILAHPEVRPLIEARILSEDIIRQIMTRSQFDPATTARTGDRVLQLVRIINNVEVRPLVDAGIVPLQILREMMYAFGSIEGPNRVLLIAGMINANPRIRDLVQTGRLTLDNIRRRFISQRHYGYLPGNPPTVANVIDAIIREYGSA